MSDMTTDLIDEDVIAPQSAPAKRKSNTEFMVYFAIIFVATLPLATLTWAMHAIKSRSLPEKGPVARAWSQTRIITPMIFSAY